MVSNSGNVSRTRHSPTPHLGGNEQGLAIRCQKLGFTRRPEHLSHTESNDEAMPQPVPTSGRLEVKKQSTWAAADRDILIQ